MLGSVSRVLEGSYSNHAQERQNEHRFGCQPSGIKSVEFQNGLWSTIRNKKCGISKWFVVTTKERKEDVATNWD